MRFLRHDWSATTVGEVESGRRRVSTDELVGLAVALNVAFPDLLAPRSPERLELGPESLSPWPARAFLYGRRGYVLDPEGRLEVRPLVEEEEWEWWHGKRGSD
jgi:hypothetical protein